MPSKHQPEGYFLSDNRMVGEGIFESATLTCSHCQSQILKNLDRTRARGYCPKCDHYVCDFCEVERVRSGICKPFNQIADEILNQSQRKLINYG